MGAADTVEIIHKNMRVPHHDTRDQLFAALSFCDFTNLIHRYYLGENTKNLLSEYSLSCTTQKFVSRMPTFYVDTLCPYCTPFPMSAKGLSRDDSCDVVLENKFYCEKCGHTQSPRIKCTCNRCLNFIDNALTKSIEKSILTAKDNSHILMEDAQTRIFLAAVLRSGQDEDNPETIYPAFLGKDTKLAPTFDFALYIVSYLKRWGWIRFNEKTPHDSLIVDEDGVIRQYYPLKAIYTLNVDDSFTAMDELISPNIIVDEERYEINTIWTSICFFECIEYLKHKLDEYKMPDNIGPKTDLSIKEGLKHYSTSQMFNHIWYAVKEAAAQSNKAGITKKHAVNMIPGLIQRRIERAIAEGWDIKPYGRDFNLPQSLIADVLFNKVLKIGNRGFNEVPPRIELKEYLVIDED
ncbi:MAG: hypothetical protein PHT07_10775 [Paludibacter sp.]|nr:hypothetical protein [Paludibacter sp.]